MKWVPGGQVLGKVLASTALDVADEEGPSRLVMVTKRASDIVVAAALNPRRKHGNTPRHILRC